MKIAALLLVSLWALTVHAQTGGVTTVTERGVVSVSLPVSYLESRLLNSDGSFASYKGYQWGIGIDIQVWRSATSEFRLFGSYLVGEAKGDPSSNIFKRDETFFGLKVLPNPHVFLAAGMGRMTNKVSGSTASEVTLTSPISGFGAGFEIPMNESWYWALGAWYKSGPIKQGDNSGISHNSFVDGAELQFQLIWSPPATTMNFNRGSR
ncbi:MAG: hypothetical protein ACK5P7_13255 [Bdellovibrio sp.]|jgi:hypothetical protein